MYAIVQHSACGYKGDLQFSGGLETRAVDTKAQIARVERVGGLLFDEYGEAEDFCDWAMYTASNCKTLIPNCRRVGRFDYLQVDGLRIFCPLAGMVDAFKADPHAPLPSN